MAKTQDDPYAPPPMHHDRSGAVVRVAIMAALVAAAGWAYMTYGNRPAETASNVQVGAPQQMAENTAPIPPEPMPQAAPAPTAPTAAPAPERRTTPRRSAPEPERVPPPSTSVTPPVAPPIQSSPPPVTPIPDSTQPPA